MYNEKKPLRDYIQNLILMNLTMGEMIHQLESLVVDEDFDNDDG
jgi:hypothetical protein